MTKAKRINIEVSVKVVEFDPYNTKPISTVTVSKGGEFTTDEVIAYIKSAANEVRTKALSDLSDIRAKEDVDDTIKG
jgi:hypothetical protein